MNILDFARFAALFASVTLVTATGASAQEGMFAKDLLGSVGIIPKERPRIDYRERAPLVLPPKMELRDPADPQGLHAANPQWPNDPDVAAARTPGSIPTSCAGKAARRTPSSPPWRSRSAAT